MSVSEETVNTVLAGMIFEKLSEWFERLLPGALTKSGGRRAELDIYLGELFGVRICVEAKMGYLRLRAAEEQCKRRLEEGFADVCLAVAYSDELRNASSIQEVKELLLKSKLRVAILTPAGRRFDLGDIMLNDLILVLDKHRIYQEVVGKEVVEEVAEELKGALDMVGGLPAGVLKSMAQLIEATFEIHGGGSVEEEEEEEEEEGEEG